MSVGNSSVTPLNTNDIQVNTATAGDQDMSQVVGLPDGGFFVVYENGDIQNDGDAEFTGIFGQRFDASGSKVGGEIQINSTTAGFQGEPAVSVLSDGTLAVAWQGTSGNDFNIYIQYLQADGTFVGGERVVNTNAVNGQNHPELTATQDGGLVVVWESGPVLGAGGPDGDATAVAMQRLDGTGAKIGGETVVNTFVNELQRDPVVATLNDGGWVVAWQSGTRNPFQLPLPQDGNGDGIYAQRYGANGAKVGGEFQVHTVTFSNQSQASVTALADGGFIIAWESTAGEFSGHDAESGVYAQMYDAAGARVGGEIRLHSTLVESQWEPALTALPDGGFVAIWEDEAADGDSHGIFGQRFDASGSKVGAEFRVNATTAGLQEFPDVAVLENGNIAVSWTSDGQDGSDKGVFVQVFDTGLAPPEATGRADRIQLGDGDDLFAGLGGNDTLRGGDGADTLKGGNGNDRLFGEAGADDLDGGKGRDRLFGGNDNDTLKGGKGSDQLNGGKGRDELRAGDGDDRVLGEAGADLMIGGDGDDTLIGADGFDTLEGGNGSDSLSGGKRNDVLDGGNGSDSLLGGKGGDTLDGARGEDTLIGGQGNDELTGGSKSDTFVFEGQYGDDTVTDFSPASSGGGSDLLDIDGLTGSGAIMLRQFARLSNDSTGDTVFQQNGQSITFVGVTLDQFTPDDFI